MCGYKERGKLDTEHLSEETHLEFEFNEADPAEVIKFKKWKEKFLKSEVKNFICPYCKSTKAYIYYRHMRAFSKPTNLFVECLNCRRLLRRDNY